MVVTLFLLVADGRYFSPLRCPSPVPSFLFASSHSPTMPKNKCRNGLLFMSRSLPSGRLCERHKCELFVFSVFFICDIMNDICTSLLLFSVPLRLEAHLNAPLRTLNHPLRVPRWIPPLRNLFLAYIVSDMLSIHQFL